MNPADIVAVGTGTTGAVALLVYIVKTLWASHVKQDDDVRAQRDVALADGRVQDADNRAQTAAMLQMADAFSKLTEELRRAKARAGGKP